jgi:hypothetical protein
MQRTRAIVLGGTLALALLMSGCGGGIGDAYTVFVDPAFSHEEQAKVVAAVDSWQAAVPVYFAVVIGTCSGVHDETICTHASNHDEVAAKQGAIDGIGVGITMRENTWGHEVDGGEVFIDVPTVEAGYADDFQRIVAHEIGHAMQLEHDAFGNLMSPMATEDAPTPTCTDDAEWYAARGRKAPACG